MSEYFITVIEEYTNTYDERPFNTEREGLFKSYRDASEYLVDEGFDLYTEQYPFTDEWELYFEIPSYNGSESYVGYIEKWKVK